jgi:hypothetical protein
LNLPELAASGALARGEREISAIDDRTANSVLVAWKIPQLLAPLHDELSEYERV